MSNIAIEQMLIDKGRELFEAPKSTVQFTKNPQADALLNDLDHRPHAFVLACVMDRQIKAELAWLVPHRISEKLGTFKFPKLAELSEQQIQNLMGKPEPLHRFPNKMAGYFHAAVRRIDTDYATNAAGIWSGMPSSAAVVLRFLQFDGVGPKIATMAANILARELKVPFSDYYSVDISADVHVRRVFERLGLIRKSATNEELIYRARSASPEFPGLLDYPGLANWTRVVQAATAPMCGLLHATSLSHRGQLESEEVSRGSSTA